MENPFSDLPTDTAMTSICNTIEINIKQLLNESQTPSVLSSDTFYIM